MEYLIAGVVILMIIGLVSQYRKQSRGSRGDEGGIYFYGTHDSGHASGGGHWGGHEASHGGDWGDSGGDSGGDGGGGDGGGGGE